MEAGIFEEVINLLNFPSPSPRLSILLFDQLAKLKEKRALISRTRELEAYYCD